MRESIVSMKASANPPQQTPLTQNKLKVFQRLKKGTVFKDENFEAKRPDAKSGVIVANRY